MRTFFLSLVCVIFFTGMTFGQYYYIPTNINPPGNPSGLNNDNEEPLNDGLPPGWTNIDPMDNSPAWTTVQNIPFNFQFNGAPVTQYKVSNTGILTFTTAASTVPGSSNNILPDASIPDKSVCIWGISFSGPFSNDRIVTKTFGTAPNRQHWIQFNTYNHPNPQPQWTFIYISIVLEEGTNNIYIVDQRCNGKGAQPTMTIGVQINSSTATMVTGSPNVGPKSGSSKTPIDNRYYTFIHGSPPTRDVGVSWLQLGSFLILNAGPFDVKGKVKNYTGNAVNSYDINYSVNNGPVLSANMTGAAHQIPGYGEEWFIHDSLWTPPDTGVYYLKFWATNINGGNDQNNSNDTMYKTIEVSTAFTPKMRLFEEFTSSTCLDCNDANVNLKSVLDLYPSQFALIKYPMNYPDAGDPYYTVEGGARRTYYGVDSLPDMFVHGNVVVDPLYLDTFQFDNLWNKSYMMINPTHTRSGNTFTVTASVLPFQTFNQGTLVLRFAVVENTTTQNVGTNGETMFYSTFHKFIPDANGINMGTLIEKVFKNETRSYTFPASNNIENMNNLSVVVFVQDDATKEVYQAAYSQLISSVDDKAVPQSIIRVAPNPASHTTTLYYLMEKPGIATIDIHNMNGQLVRSYRHNNIHQGIHQQDISLDGISAGVYIIRLINGSSLDTQRLIVR